MYRLIIVVVAIFVLSLFPQTVFANGAIEATVREIPCDIVTCTLEILSDGTLVHQTEGVLEVVVESPDGGMHMTFGIAEQDSLTLAVGTRDFFIVTVVNRITEEPTSLIWQENLGILRTFSGEPYAICHDNFDESYSAIFSVGKDNSTDVLYENGEFTELGVGPFVFGGNCWVESGGFSYTASDANTLTPDTPITQTKSLVLGEYFLSLEVAGLTIETSTGDTYRVPFWRTIAFLEEESMIVTLLVRTNSSAVKVVTIDVSQFD